SREEIPFSFSKNNFTKNNSSIFIEDLESDILNLRFNYNLITQNYFLGFEVGGRLNAPISVNYNKKELKYTTTFLGNSIFSNYLLHNTNDTVIQEVNFGIRGRAEKFSLDTNYFGIKSHIEIQKSFDHFNNHQASPYLSLNGILISPSDSVHGHIWKIAINTIVLEENANLPAITSQKLGMQINYNRPLLVRQGINYVSYIYFDETGKELKTKSLSCALKLDQINKNIQFTTNDDVYIKNPVGYFSFTGLTDNEGITVPKVYAGKEQFKIYLINNNLNFNLE
ncbi:MAG: hypothetical protein M3Q58_12515, partial [Bacteroidota bacterium]|nr:hypothetical protein [Bacteroidota bacterium]